MHHGSRFSQLSFLIISESKQPRSTPVNPRFKSNHAIERQQFLLQHYDGPIAAVPGLTIIYRIHLVWNRFASFHHSDPSNGGETIEAVSGFCAQQRMRASHSLFAVKAEHQGAML